MSAASGRGDRRGVRILVGQAATLWVLWHAFGPIAKLALDAATRFPLERQVEQFDLSRTARLAGGASRTTEKMVCGAHPTFWNQ